MSKVTGAVKWVFSHEPAILAGVIAGVSVFFAIRYGTQANGAVQGLSGSWVALMFSTLRNWVTPPAGQKLAAAQANLPALYKDVDSLWNTLAPAVKHPQGLPGLLADHFAAVKAEVADAVQRVHQIVRGAAPTVPADKPADAIPADIPAAPAKPAELPLNDTDPTPATQAAPQESPAPAEPDPIAQLGAALANG